MNNSSALGRIRAGDRLPSEYRLALAVILWAVGGFGTLAAEPRTMHLAVDPQRVVNAIDPKIYGQFLEHIYHATNGGLWGDIVWNRSFEELPGGGDWVAAGEEIVQRSLGADQRLIFGDPKCGDSGEKLRARLQPVLPGHL